MWFYSRRLIFLLCLVFIYPLKSKAEPISFLKTYGTKIVTETGEPIVLRGYGLGGWLNWEGFINGFSSVEAEFREKVIEILGEQKGQLFLTRMVDYYLSEADVKFIKGCGLNSLRVPFNYRHFERDDQPYQYLDYGFQKLDQLIAWAKKYHIYLILDLHAAQGWQNGTYPADNPSGEAYLWTHKLFQDRVIALWVEIAKRYCNEPIIAGYELLNEPMVGDSLALNRFYFNAVPEIRKADPRHIIFLEGDYWGKEVNTLSPPFADNLVYVNHCYYFHLVDVDLQKPIDEATLYQQLKKAYQKNVDWSIKHNVPMWAGEFGIWFRDDELDVRQLKILELELKIIEEAGHSWNLWTYKDIGFMGLLRVDPKSSYLTITEQFHKLRDQVGLYSHNREQGVIDQVVESARPELDSQIPEELHEALLHSFRVGATTGFDKVLLPVMVNLFKNLSEAEIDLVLQSWKLKNCVVREDLLKVVRKYCQ